MNETFRYPIKVLLDEDRNIFIPFITSNAVLVSGTNENVAQQIANRYTKAEVDALIESSLSNKLDISKVKNVKDTTAGNVYDTTYINSVVGNIEELLGGI